MPTPTPDAVNEFILAACVPRGGESHANGDLERAEAIRREFPGLEAANIHTAAILGEEASVRTLLARDPASATTKGGPHDWDALTHLCFSRYLRLDAARSDGFVGAATALLDAGASANTGWWAPEPEPEWEPALYGAAGIAHHAPLTRLLLSRGANPRDAEVVYHTPETRDNAALAALVESGKLAEEDLALMLLRKHDWHDRDGQEYLLARGANPNLRWRHGLTALHHALERDNGLSTFELLLDHGADPAIACHGLTAVARAARRGRSDVLELFERRGLMRALEGVDALIAACARGDGARARAIMDGEPALGEALRAMGGDLLAAFAGNDNAAGIRVLLDLGVDVAAPYASGDGYWGEPRGSLAIHVAAWRASESALRVLVERGSPADAPDPNGRTPLVLAIRACVDSYWTQHCSPGSIRMLLDTGASPDRVPFPTGHAEVDEVLRPHRAHEP